MAILPDSPKPSLAQQADVPVPPLPESLSDEASIRFAGAFESVGLSGSRHFADTKAQQVFSKCVAHFAVRLWRGAQNLLPAGETAPRAFEINRENDALIAPAPKGTSVVVQVFSKIGYALVGAGGLGLVKGVTQGVVATQFNVTLAASTTGDYVISSVLTAVGVLIIAVLPRGS